MYKINPDQAKSSQTTVQSCNGLMPKCWVQFTGRSMVVALSLLLVYCPCNCSLKKKCRMSSSLFSFFHKTWKSSLALFQLSKTDTNISVHAHSCLTLCDAMDYVACQITLSIGFPRQEYWSKLLFTSPGPNRGRF